MSTIRSCVVVLFGLLLSSPALSVNSTVTVVKPGSGSGTIVANSGVINCGATCSGPYADGAAVTLTATADAGSSIPCWWKQG